MTQSEPNDVKLGAAGEPIRGSSSNEFQHKQLIGGRYEVISTLGKGGMGIVYRVNQVFLNKQFALKTIDKNCMSEIAVRRFQQEARTAFSLDHPSIIAVNDFGLLEDQTPFLVMELINGETLGERLKRVGCLTLEQAIPIFVQVCFGLAYAHGCGIVHRDIKPNNIMLLNGLPLGADGSVKIVDFGIAKFTGHEGGEVQALTKTGEIFGSPLYMSPEQCSGFRVDHRADIYALGCVLFEALTGTPPFIGNNALSTMMKHQGDRAPTLKEGSLGADFPQAMEDIVATMLAKSPTDRYQNLGLVAHDLGALKRGASISSAAKKQVGIEAKAQASTISMTRTSFYALMAGVAVLFLSIGIGAGYVLHTTKGPDSTVPKTETGKAEPAVGKVLAEKVADETDYAPISMEVLKKQLARRTADDRFSISHNKVTSKDIEVLSGFSWIRRLSLNDCSISNESLGQLSKLHLLRIDLANSNFDDVGAKGLSACHELSQIEVPMTNISDDGVAILARLKSLTNLAIAGPRITDRSLVELGKCKGLGYLNLVRAKQITNQGLKALEHSHLNNLNLESTLVDDSGLAQLAKIETLRIINLNRTQVTIEGLKELCRRSKAIKEISIRKCPNIQQADVNRLRSSCSAAIDFQPADTSVNKSDRTSAKEPDISDYDPMPPKELQKQLADQAKRGTHFTLSSQKLTDASLAMIADAEWIKTLNLHNCEISNEGLKRFARLHLSTVTMNGSTLNDIGAEGLSLCEGIHEIRANETLLTDKGIAKLAKMKGLQVLSLGKTGLTEKSLSELAKSKSLEHLELEMDNGITNESLGVLENSKLKYVSLASTPIDDSGMPYLARINSLGTVILNRTKVTVKGIERLIKTSKKCRAVTLLDCPNIGQKELHSLRTEFPEVLLVDKDPSGRSNEI